jgi:hypothetical protein
MEHGFIEATLRLASLVLSLAIISLSACSVPRSVKEGGTIPGQQVIPAKKVLVLAIKDGQEQGQPPAAGSGAGSLHGLGFGGGAREDIWLADFEMIEPAPPLD